MGLLFGNCRACEEALHIQGAVVEIQYAAVFTRSDALVGDPGEPPVLVVSQLTIVASKSQ